jgi:hypothetical protein
MLSNFERCFNPVNKSILIEHRLNFDNFEGYVVTSITAVRCILLIEFYDKIHCTSVPFDTEVSFESPCGLFSWHQICCVNE